MTKVCPHCKKNLEVIVSVSVRESKKTEAPKNEGIKSDPFDGWQSWDKTAIRNGRPEPIATLYENKDKTLRVYVTGDGDPYRVKGSRQRLICAYKALLGIHPWDREWDNSIAGFSRCMKAATQILNDLSIGEAIKCLVAVKAWSDRSGLSWTLETVAKKTMDYKYGRLP